MWIPTIGVLVHFIGEHIPAEFIKDRKEGYLGIDISKAAMAPSFMQHLEFVRAQIDGLVRRCPGNRSCWATSPARLTWRAAKPSSYCARSVRSMRWMRCLGSHP